jgi:alkylation response protein AidB-like acyl-CoA dehydrogenase
MDLNPSEEQQHLISTFSSFYAKECPVDRVRAAEPSGHDAALWSQLIALGVVEMAVDESSGGWGATLLDLALVAEQHGRHLGPAPLIEGQVAGRLLARIGRGPSSELLGRFLGGDRLVTLALHPGKRDALALVPAGAIADDVVYLQDERLLWAEVGDQRRPVRNTGSMPVADIAIGTAVVLASGPEATALFELARDEWLVLMANALVGLGERSIEIAVEYVKERHAFGVPIGSFQAVAHGLADAATAVDGSKLLAREAAWAADDQPARASQLASLSYGFSAEAARVASYRSLHYHGGYGFMLEFAIQLFFRRAVAWPAQYGEPCRMFARAERNRLASLGRRD